MTDDLTRMAKDLAYDYAPWAEGVRWWVVLIQGVALLALGAFILFVPGTANKTAVEILGLYLLIGGALDAWQGIRGRVSPSAMPYHMLAAGSGITTGIVVLIDLFEGLMSLQSAAVIVSVGLIFVGIMRLIVWIVGGESGNRRWLGLILPVGLLVLGGAAIFTRLEGGATIIRWLGIIAMVSGALLLIQAFVLYGKQNNQQDMAQRPQTAAAAPREVDKGAGESAQPPSKDTGVK